MKHELEVDVHHKVAPFPNVHGHGPVTGIGPEVFVCLDCGYTAEDIRRFSHENCEREKNPANSTWRERLEQYPAMDVLDMRSGELKREHGE